MRGKKPNLKSIEGGRARLIDPPDYLGDIASAEWHRVAPILADHGLLSEDVLSLLANYCQAIEAARDCAKIISEQGRIISVPGQMPKPHPAVRQELSYLDASRRLAAELGITAISRARTPKQKGGMADEWQGMDL